MDDDRAERALRARPLDEPLYDRPPFDPSLAMQRATPRRPIWRSLLGAMQVAAVAVVAVAFMGTVLLLRGSPPSGSTATPPAVDALARIRADGRVRIAIRPDFPQVSAAGSVAGFDVDVATELARRLGVSPEVIVLPATSIAPEAGHWDLAFPSGGLTASATGSLRATDPYYFWPAFLVVADDGSVNSLGDLAGRTVCVVDGSAGEAWLDGRLGGRPVQVREPAPGAVTIRRAPDDGACLDAVTDGSAAAAVTSMLSEADIAVRPGVTRLGGPVLTEARSIVASDPGAASDSLVAEIDRLLGDMRADGTLTDISRRRFGGADLSDPSAR